MYIIIFHNHICTDVPIKYTIIYWLIIYIILSTVILYLIDTYDMCEYTSAPCTSMDHGLKASIKFEVYWIMTVKGVGKWSIYSNNYCPL